MTRRQFRGLPFTGRCHFSASREQADGGAHEPLRQSIGAPLVPAAPELFPAKIDKSVLTIAKPNQLGTFLSTGSGVFDIHR